MERPNVVIVGCGFAGLYCTRALARAPVRVTLVDRRNHHLFQPLLYQVATAGLSPGDIAYPVRSFIRNQRNLDVVLAEVSAFDLAGRRVLLSDGRALRYEQLLVATGAGHSYFGRPDWARFAPGLKTIEDAVEIRRRIFVAFEEAEQEPDPARRGALLSFVIVGGGPTGVELAGALAEIAHHTLASEFHRIDPRRARILLLEGTPRLLPAYTPDLSESARRQLASLGVEVRTDAMVTDIDEAGVRVGDERVPARTVLWAAGVAASPLGRALGAPLDRAGRVKVEPDLTLPGHPEVYAAGDLAVVVRRDGQLVPGLAPAAIQEGKHAGRNIARLARGLPLLPFRYRNKGAIATIGRAAAVADLPWAKLSGRLAWWLWVGVHIYFLIGFRNRFAVLLQWAWQRFVGRGMRLITGERHPLELLAPEARPAQESGAARAERKTAPGR